MILTQWMTFFAVIRKLDGMKDEVCYIEMARWVLVSLPEVKQPGRGVDQPPLFRAEVKGLLLWACLAYSRVKFTLPY